MRRLAGILLAIIGLALLIGTRYLGSLPDSAFTSGTTPEFVFPATIVGYIFGLALFSFGLQRALRPNSRGPSLGKTMARTARTAVIRLIVVVVIFAVLIGAGVAVLAGGSPETKQAVLNALFECRTQLHKFTPTSVGFSVEFPGTDDPTDQTTIPTTGDTSLPVHEYSSTCGLGTYYVVYIDLPAGTGSASTDAKATLQGDLQGFVQADTGKLISSQDITLGSNFPGVQFVVEQPSESTIGKIISKTATIYGAEYLVNDRLYSVFTVMPTTVDSQTRDAAFLQSFSAS